MPPDRKTNIQMYTQKFHYNVPHSAIGFAVGGVNFQGADAIVNRILMLSYFAVSSGPIAEVDGVFIVERNGVCVCYQGVLEALGFHELVSCER